jgi:recombination associated protein RdgC
MFKNAIVYATTPGFRFDQNLLLRRVARDCGASEASTTGFAQPCDHASDHLVHHVAGSQLICFQSDEKLLPGAVVSDAVKKKTAQFEKQNGFKPSRKQLSEIRETVFEDLLPKAFAVKKRTYALMTDKYFFIDSSSSARADLLNSDLLRAFDTLPFTKPNTHISPTAAMTDWLISGDAPEGFTLDRDCELKSPVEEKATVRYVRHALETEEITKHISAGKYPTKLAMTWDDRISFVLTDGMEIKRLDYLDIFKEEAEANAETMEESFDANIALMAGEMTRMMDDLVDKLGGIISSDEDLLTNEQNN